MHKEGVQTMQQDIKKGREEKRTGYGVCVTGGLLSTSQLLLPVHLVEEILRAQEKVIYLAALLVPLGGVVHSQFGLLCEELADVGDRKHYLLHGAIQTYNLNTTTTVSFMQQLDLSSFNWVFDTVFRCISKTLELSAKKKTPPTT